MTGKAYIADMVKRDMLRLAELVEEIKSNCRGDIDSVEEWAEVNKILESYNE